MLGGDPDRPCCPLLLLLLIFCAKCPLNYRPAFFLFVAVCSSGRCHPHLCWSMKVRSSPLDIIAIIPNRPSSVSVIWVSDSQLQHSRQTDRHQATQSSKWSPFTPSFINSILSFAVGQKLSPGWTTLIISQSTRSTACVCVLYLDTKTVWLPLVRNSSNSSAESWQQNSLPSIVVVVLGHPCGTRTLSLLFLLLLLLSSVLIVACENKCPLWFALFLQSSSATWVHSSHFSLLS